MNEQSQSQFKETLKRLLKQLNIAFTKNQIYDKQTSRIIKKVVYADSNCVDVGAHTGDIMGEIMKFAPLGTHYAFEPVPILYEILWRKYQYYNNVNTFDMALSNETGTSTFNYVMTNPAYSGLLKRKYDRKTEEDVTLLVKVDKLDNIIPSDMKIEFMKIDVEGGELNVMKGAIETIKRSKPYIIFEHGIGGADVYNATPEEVFDLLTGCGLKISKLKGWLANESPLSKQKFREIYDKRTDWYFLAHPDKA